MQLLKNEKGMALVLVLLIISVFTVLGLSVMASTINNAKQVKMSENNIETTDIAEMGVRDYQAQLLDYFNTQLNSKVDTYKDLIIQDFNSGTDKTIASAMKNAQSYQDKIATDMIEAFKISITTGPNPFVTERDVDQTTQKKYKITIEQNPISVSTSDQEKIKVVFHSFGYNQNQLEKEITATFVYTFSFNQDSLQTSSVPVKQFNFETIVPKPSVNGPCPPTIIDKQNDADFGSQKCTFSRSLAINKASFSQSTIIFTNGLYIDKINQGINQSNLYIIGNPGLPIVLNDSHVNGIDGSNIYMEGTVKFGTINQGLNGSKIVIKGTAIFGIDSNDKFKGLTNSSIYVTGIADFTNFDLSNKFDSLSKICVNGDVIGANNVSGYPVYYSKQQDLKNYNDNCSTGIAAANSLSFTSNLFSMDPAVLIDITYN